jgi:hypothetical protein
MKQPTSTKKITAQNARYMYSISREGQSLTIPFVIDNQQHTIVVIHKGEVYESI